MFLFSDLLSGLVETSLPERIFLKYQDKPFSRPACYVKTYIVVKWDSFKTHISLCASFMIFQLTLFVLFHFTLLSPREHNFSQATHFRHHYPFQLPRDTFSAPWPISASLLLDIKYLNGIRPSTWKEILQFVDRLKIMSLIRFIYIFKIRQYVPI